MKKVKVYNPDTGKKEWIKTGSDPDTIPLNSDLDKASVGLDNVDNTSDADKPVSTATQSALDGIRQLPNAIPTDRGKILTVNVQGNAFWDEVDTGLPDWLASGDNVYPAASPASVLSNLRGGNFAIGYGSKVESLNNINPIGAFAIGLNAETSATDGIAIGTNVKTSMSQSVVIGNNSSASAYTNVILGTQITSIGSSSVLLGKNIQNTSSQAVAIGELVQTDTKGVAIGAKTSVGVKGVAIGSESYCSSYGVAIGSEASAWSIAIGNRAKSSGMDGISIGYLSVSSSSKGVALGPMAEASGSKSTALGADSKVTGNNEIQLGSSSETTYAYGAIQDRSDARDKADITPSNLGLDFINRLNPVSFVWDYRDYYREKLKAEHQEGEAVEAPFLTRELNDPSECTLNDIKPDGSLKRSRPHYGLIAQEVKQVMDDLGIDFGGFKDHTVTANGEDSLSLGYTEFIAPMIKAIQELSAEVQDLKDQIKADSK